MISSQIYIHKFQCVNKSHLFFSKKIIHNCVSKIFTVSIFKILLRHNYTYQDYHLDQGRFFSYYSLVLLLSNICVFMITLYL